MEKTMENDEHDNNNPSESHGKSLQDSATNSQWARDATRSIFQKSFVGGASHLANGLYPSDVWNIRMSRLINLSNYKYTYIYIYIYGIWVINQLLSGMRIQVFLTGSNASRFIAFFSSRAPTQAVGSAHSS